MNGMSTVRSVVDLARDRNITFLAAGIAYYGFVSLIPLVLLAVVVASAVGGEALADRVTSMLEQQLSSAGAATVAQTITHTTGSGAASVDGLVTLTWSALKLFRGLDQAFDEVYTDELDTPFLVQIRDALVVILGIGLAAVLVVAVAVALAVLPLDIPFVNVLGTVVLVVVLTVAFLPIYYVLPPLDVSLREVIPGAAVAAVGWVLLQIGFRIYTSNANRYGAYGLIGAMLLFVTWLYFASIVVLLGAAVNAVRRGVRTETA
jgi:membrane protein